jgi:hypothetical protein
LNLLDSGLDASTVMLLVVLFCGESQTILASNVLGEELITVILQLLSVLRMGFSLTRSSFLTQFLFVEVMGRPLAMLPACFKAASILARWSGGSFES